MYQFSDNEYRRMSDAYQDGVWFPILLVAVAYVIGRIMVKLRILTNDNFSGVAKWLSISIGAIYALAFDPVRSFGSADVFIRMGAGVMVALAIWVFIVIGIGVSLPEQPEKSAQAPRQKEGRKGE